jgi:hypothetical protein
MSSRGNGESDSDDDGTQAPGLSESSFLLPPLSKAETRRRSKKKKKKKKRG